MKLVDFVLFLKVGKKKKKAHFEPGTETVFLFIDAHWQLRVHAVSLVLQPVT